MSSLKSLKPHNANSAHTAVAHSLFRTVNMSVNGARSMDRMRLLVELLLARGYFTDLMSSTEMMDSTDMPMAIGKI